MGLGERNSRQPGFREALLADARVTAAHRGERHMFRSRIDAAVQITRLIWTSDAFIAQALYRLQTRLHVLGVPMLPRLAHRLAMATAQVSIGDPVIVHPGVYLVHGQVVIDGLVEIHSGVVDLPVCDDRAAGGELVRPDRGARRQGRHRRQDPRTDHDRSGRPASAPTRSSSGTSLPARRWSAPRRGRWGRRAQASPRPLGDESRRRRRGNRDCLLDSVPPAGDRGRQMALIFDTQKRRAKKVFEEIAALSRENGVAATPTPRGRSCSSAIRPGSGCSTTPTRRLAGRAG